MIRFCLLILFLIFGCGVEIGNPKKPEDDSNPSDKNIEGEELAIFVGLGIDEVLNSTTTMSSSQMESLSLTALEQDLSCVEEGNDAIVNRYLELQQTRVRGRRPIFQRTINSEITQMATLRFAGNDIKINCIDNKAQIPWSSIEELAISREYQSQRSRQVLRTSSGEEISKTTLNIVGTYDIQIQRDTYTDEVVSLTESHSFNISKNLSYSGKKYQFKSKNGDDPLIIKKQRSSERIQIYQIDSGQLIQTFNSGATIEIEYENFAFEPASCLPLSGGLSISYRSSQEDKPVSYSVSVVEEELVLDYDGQSILIDLEPCDLNGYY